MEVKVEDCNRSLKKKVFLSVLHILALGIVVAVISIAMAKANDMKMADDVHGQLKVNHAVTEVVEG